METQEQRAERLLNNFIYDDLIEEQQDYLHDALNFSLNREWDEGTDVGSFVYESLFDGENILTNILTEFSRNTMVIDNNGNNGNNANNANNAHPVLGPHPPITVAQRETFLRELIAALEALGRFTRRQQRNRGLMSENLVETPEVRTPMGSNNENENGMNGSQSPSYAMRPRKSRKAKSRKSRKSRNRKSRKAKARKAAHRK